MPRSDPGRLARAEILTKKHWQFAEAARMIGRRPLAVARELAPHQITVNTIAPGPVETEMLLSMPADWLEAKRAEMPLGRFGRVEEIAPTAVLLASVDGGAFITGAVLNVSGGDVMCD